MEMTRISRAAAVLLALALQASAAAQNPVARNRSLSPPDCVDVSSMAVQYEPAPVNRTYMRVQHMGDPGTAELLFQVGAPVTWDVGTFTGLFVPPESQRGYADAPGRNAFQLRCGDAGFFVDTASFSHSSPLVGQGPNVSIARDFEPPLAAFARGEALLIEADVKVPWARPRSPAVVEGTAQVGFFLYMRDRTTGIVVTQAIALFDDRPAGVNGVGAEGLGDDGFNAFVSSPLALRDGLGRPVRFVTPLASSATMQYQQAFADSRHFAALVTPAHFAAALAELRGKGLGLSTQPADYEVLSFGINGEVIAGTARVNDVALGASVSGLALSAVPAQRFARH
jgi:hypothetical protein